MNGYERIHAALRGEPSDTVPVSLHNFLMAAEEAGYTQGQYREDPVKITDSFIRAVEKYRYDGILVDIDTVTLAGAVGVPVDFPEKECARTHRGSLLSLEAVRDLKPAHILEYRYVGVWLKAVRKLADYFRSEISIRGNCDQAPFSLASMMRGAQNWMMDLYDESNAGLVFELLDYCCDAVCQFLEAMAQTGADILSNGDSVAGPAMISPAMYEKYGLPYEQKCAEKAHSLGKPYILHICGNTDPILHLFEDTGADCMELDYLTDIEKIREIFNESLTLSGNIDPSGVLTYGSPEDVRKAVIELLEQFRGSNRLILNSGCAVPATAPPENIKTMVETARDFGSITYQ
jgi:uroporphyrinogen decarboxylase